MLLTVLINKFNNNKANTSHDVQVYYYKKMELKLTTIQDKCRTLL